MTSRRESVGARAAQHVAVQRRLLILPSLVEVLAAFPELVLLLMFSFLVTVRFGLSQQVVRGKRFVSP